MLIASLENLEYCLNKVIVGVLTSIFVVVTQNVASTDFLAKDHYPSPRPTLLQVLFFFVQIMIELCLFYSDLQPGFTD